MNTGDRENAVQNTLCDELRDLLPAYGLGLLTPEETKRVEWLLPQCPDTAGDLSTYQDINDSLLVSVAPVAPPSHVRASLLTKIAEMESATAVTKVLARPIALSNTPVVTPIPRLRPPRLWQALSAAAILVLVLTNAYWLLSQSTTQQQVTELQQQQAALVSLMSNDQAVRVELVSTSDTAPEQLATVFRNDAENSLVLLSDRLMPLASNQTYQLWLISDNKIVSVGIFDANRSLYTFAVDDLQGYPILGISIEPASGSDQPTTTPIAMSESA